MYLIPDIINLPEISIEPTTRILYFSILYHGSLMILPETTPQVENLTQDMYVHCLRAIPAWRKHASGTKTDLITAILLVRPLKFATISRKLRAEAANFESSDASCLGTVRLRI